jgi:mycofactocin precursor
MVDASPPPVPAPEKLVEDRAGAPEVLVVLDDLVEDVSIDGMCGVY